MKRYFFFLALGLLATETGWGQTVHVNAVAREMTGQRDRVSSIVSQLPASGPWTILLVRTETILNTLRSQGLTAKTDGSCYTDIPNRVTFCDWHWAERATDERITQVLRHEYGHLLCACLSEDKANDAARHWIMQ